LRVRPSIRGCLAEDVPAVVNLHETLAQEEVLYGYVAASYDELMSKIGPFFLVAEVAGQIVGYIYGSLHISDGLAVIPQGEAYFEVDELYVLAEWRDQSVGGELLDRLLDMSAAQGIERYLVYSANKDIERVLRFYQRHGFKSWCIQLYR
jgi:ribosomal protein S18 acetylase RimI-like enzyme